MFSPGHSSLHKKDSLWFPKQALGRKHESVASDDELDDDDDRRVEPRAMLFDRQDPETT
jgi:hypothetical protein